MSDECIPARMKQARGSKSVGDPCSRRAGISQAREELVKREGPPQEGKNVCCHTCPNDSSAPNGFVCTLHTRWGTHSENRLDISVEERKAAAKLGHARLQARWQNLCRSACRRYPYSFPSS